MILRSLLYYTLDHPFKDKEKILFSNRNKAVNTAGQIREVDRNPNEGNARYLRVHISPDKEDQNKDSERLSRYEQIRQKKEYADFNRAKTIVIMRFARSLIIGYLLYLAPETFWNPIVTLFNMVAHGLSDYARWCVILFLPLKAFLRTFGTFFYYRGKFNLGIPGMWHRVHEGSKALEVYDKTDKTHLELLKEDIDDYLKALEKKADREGQKKLKDKLSTLFKEKELKKDSREILEELDRIIEDHQESELWSEMIRLEEVKEEILYRSTTDWDTKAPIYHFYPASGPTEIPMSPMATIRFQSYKKQAEKLRNWTDSPLIQKLKKSVLEDYRELNEAKTNEERVEILQRLSGNLERLRDEVGRLHLGENIFIPNEKGNDPALFYHGLYNLFGQALCELEKGYRRAGWGFFLLKSNQAGRRRIKTLINETDLFIQGEYRNRSSKLIRNLSAAGGKNAARGLGLAAMLLFITGSLFSFYRAGPGETIILNKVRLGYQGQFINREIEIVESEIPLLGWHLPRPFVSHTVINEEKKTIPVYMVMGEFKTENMIGKLMTGLSGQLGTKFDIVELEILYKPVNPQVWSLYNSDGKGERRLLRDLSELAEEWRDSRGMELSVLSSLEFDHFFRELTDKGILEEYLKRSFSQTTFSTNIYYGSLSERFDSGIDAVLREFERTLDLKKADIHADDEEIAALEADLATASQIVRDLKLDIKEQVKLEYNSLRSDPRMLDSLVSDPYGNAQKLKDFETLWVNLSNYVQYLYRQQELTEMLSRGFIDLSLKEEARQLYPMQLELTEYLQENSLIKELIDIQSVRFKHKVIGLTEFTQYQEKWKDTI